MKIYKFRIRDEEDRSLPSDPSLVYSGCFAAAVADNEDAARALLTNALDTRGVDARWLERGCADVIELPLEPGVIGWAVR